MYPFQPRAMQPQGLMEQYLIAALPDILLSSPRSLAKACMGFTSILGLPSLHTGLLAHISRPSEAGTQVRQTRMAPKGLSLVALGP